MILTVTNLKGGVGKTTLSSMLALYAASQLEKDVLLIDMDPQAGTSSLLLGGNIEGITISDALEQALDGNPPEEMMQAAIRQSPTHPRIRVIPADRRLTNFAANGAPVDLLNYAIQSLSLPETVLVIVDTGTSPALVSMGMVASDGILVPMTMSRQTVRPTANTLSYLIRQKRDLVGIVPVGAGESTGWGQEVLASWRARLSAIPEIANGGGEVFPPLAHSNTIVRGNWISGKIPEKFLPTLSRIFQKIELEQPAEQVEQTAAGAAPEGTQPEKDQ